MSIVSFNNLELNANVVTIIDKNDKDKVWFKARDIASALGHKNTKRAIGKFVGDKHRATFEEIQGGTNYHDENIQPHTVFILEPGVYQLIFRSQLPSAERFQDWVFEEVLPSIRKTGTYTIPTMLETATSLNDNKLAALPYDEKKEMRRVLVYKADLCKDPEKVEMGRLGGYSRDKV